MPSTSRETKPGLRNKSVAPASRETGLSVGARCFVLPVGCMLEASSENWVLLNWVGDTRKPAKLSGLHVANKHSSVSAFLHPAMIPASRRAIVFLTKEDVKTLQHIGWYWATLDPVQGTYRMFSSSAVVMKAVVCASSSTVISFFSPMKVGLILRGLAVLSSWEDASAPSKMVFKQLKDSSTYPWGFFSSCTGSFDLPF